MIRLLEVPTGKKKIPVILILRQTFGYNLAEANRIATSWPQDLPHIEWHRDEVRVRQALLDAECVLGETCKQCFGNTPRECPGCYDRHTHCAHSMPEGYDGPICGSMYFYTSCGRNWSELGQENPPRIWHGLSDEERTKMIAGVTCPECHESLKNCGYL